MKENILFLFLFTIFGIAAAASSENSFVVSSTEPSKENGEDSANNSPLFPIIYEMNITANISNRFAKTLVTSKVKNSDKSPKETTFTVVLPEKAFISEFVMEIEGKSYKAYVKEKEEAKNIYNQAVARGQTAGHVSVSARDSNRFTVSVNIEPESKAVFFLTYEELLQRKNGQYELVLNIHPGQIVKQLSVEVHINESRPLKFVKTPSLRSGNEISENEDKLDPSSDIQIVNSTAIVKFNPDSEKQKQFARDLGTKESDGLSGQFIIQYDVERDPHGGEVLLQDGYFVHFFAPNDLEPLAKHVVFVLDTSGSMGGNKISQLKDAMKSILNEIKEGDLLSIIEFSSNANVWDINFKNRTNIEVIRNAEDPLSALSELNLPAPLLVDGEVISKAKKVIDELQAGGMTNMIDGLSTGLYLVKVGQDTNTNTADKTYQPIIIFLTDGDPYGGIIDTTDGITEKITQLNSKNNNVPIFSLSFGDRADKKFLRELSVKNSGFSRHIYEASDASLQLQEFYKYISSPLLSNIKFKYESEVAEVTKARFPIFFRGSELVVAGKYKDASFPSAVKCIGPIGPITLRPNIAEPVTSLERLWAYLTVKQTLEERDLVKNKTELTKKALDLALKYSFVTDVTSLVVVKPNYTSAVNTEEARATEAGNKYPSTSKVLSGRLHYAPRSGGILGSRTISYYKGSSSRPDNSPFMAPHRAYWIGIPSTRLPPSPSHHAITSTRPLSPSYDAIGNISATLPWLESVANPNRTLTISQNIYELGENYSTTNRTGCPKTPVNGTDTGICTLLKECPEVHSYLTDFQVYQKYFCPVNNKYAGVCCPKKNTT